MEACVARVHVANAGEMNGFLKPIARVFRNPIVVARGNMALDKGSMPELDDDAVAAATEETATFPAA
jgi:hypothetical protein